MEGQARGSVEEAGKGVGHTLSYMPGLDGIRAVAVLAVIVYHSGFSWLPGGYFSVDAFFALSGYLITSLLLAEWDRRGGISLKAFWGRRARRLLPGLFLMLTGIGLLATVWPGTLDTPYLRLDTLATLFYVANWHFILDHANYFFVTATPSPLLHTWTLAIEEQFYIVWPLMVLAVVLPGRGSRQAKLKRLLVVSIAGALASAAWMGLVVATSGDITRAYYGTDTRAQSLLVGAALAVVLAIWRPAKGRLGRLALGAAGIGGIVVAGLMWSLVPETSTLAFRGGFLVAALGSVGVIACASQLPGNPVSRVLSIWPLRTLGKISYGVYLWYWPTLLVVDHQRTGLAGYPLLLVRLTVVVSVAALSYNLVEMPLRRASFASWKRRTALPAGMLASAISVFVATGLLAGSTGVAGASSPVSSYTPVAQGSLHLPLSVRLRPGGSYANDAGGTTLGDAGYSGLSAGRGPASPTRGGPVKILLVGDSMAGTLGVGMQQVQARFGAEVVNEGHPGCSLGAGSEFKVLWYTVPPGSPCGKGGTGRTLLALWQKWVDELNPDVTVYFARTDLFDQYVDGQWMHVGEPDFDAVLTSRLDRAIRVLSSRGGKVVLATEPYYDSGEQPSGKPWPEDNPARVLAYNRLIAKVAAANSQTTSLLDIGAILSPSGTFATVVNGVPARCGDGVHISVSGGRFVGERVLGKLVVLGEPHEISDPSGSWPGYRVKAPSWFSRLPCGA